MLICEGLDLRFKLFWFHVFQGTMVWIQKSKITVSEGAAKPLPS
jgi:hypothetical protein